MPLPHIKNSEAGINKYDPVHKNLFEVFFTIPEALQTQFQRDVMLLTQHVLSVDGLETLDKAPEFQEQKFMGTSRSYLSPKLDSTSHELTVKFTMNLRNDTDNYIYNLFKAWNKLGYNLETGEIQLKRNYCAEWLKISIANRVGDIHRQIVFKDVMMTISNNGQGSYAYDGANEALELEVKFRSDWAEEINAGSN